MPRSQSRVSSSSPKRSNRSSRGHERKRRPSGSDSERLVDFMLQHRRLNLIEHGVLTVMTYPHFYPVAFWKGEGKEKELAGLDVDVMRAFAEKCGLKVKFVTTDKFDGIWDAPSKGLADVSIGGIGNTIGRGDGHTEWTMPYFYVHRSVVYRKDDPIELFPYNVKRTIYGTKGSTGWWDAKLRMDGAMNDKDSFMQEGSSEDEDLNDLLSGKVQGLMRGDMVSRALVKRYPKKLAYSAWNILPTITKTDGETFAYPCKLGSGLAVSLTTFLVETIMNGFLKKLVVKYNLGDDINFAPIKNQQVSPAFLPIDVKTAKPTAEDIKYFEKAVKQLWKAPAGIAKRWLEEMIPTHASEEVRVEDGREISKSYLQEDVYPRIKAQIANMEACDDDMIFRLISVTVEQFMYVLREAFLEEETEEIRKANPDYSGRDLPLAYMDNRLPIRAAQTIEEHKQAARNGGIAYNGKAPAIVLDCDVLRTDFTKRVAGEIGRGKFVMYIMLVTTKAILEALQHLSGVKSNLEKHVFGDALNGGPLPRDVKLHKKK